MCPLGMWITCYVFFASCAYSQKVETELNNVITFTLIKPAYKQETDNFVDHYSNIIDLNSESKPTTRSLNIHQKATIPTSSAKLNHKRIHSHSTNSRRKFYTTEPAVKSSGHNSYMQLFLGSNFKKFSSSRQGDYTTNKAKDSFPTSIPHFQEGRRPTTSSNFFAFPTLGEELNPFDVIFKNMCVNDYDCQKNTRNSYCQIRSTGNKCACPSNLVDSGSECLEKSFVDGHCELTMQCPGRSLCVNHICKCMSGYVKKDLQCVFKDSVKSPTDRPNFLLFLVAGIVFFIVVSCLLVLILALRRKLRQERRHGLANDSPSLSTVMDARRTPSPDPFYDRVDKPPTYDEAMSASTTTLLSLNVQDIASEPPSYTQIQQQSRSYVFQRQP